MKLQLLLIASFVALIVYVVGDVAYQIATWHAQVQAQITTNLYK